MSSDPVSAYIEPVSTLIQKLVELNISVQRDMIINYKERQMEYYLHFTMPNEGSKRQDFAAKIQSHFKDPFVMEGVLDFYTALSPTHYDLKENNIASLDGDAKKFRLDIGRLMRDYKFDVASLRIIAEISELILGHWITPTESSSGKREGTKIKARLEVTIDYGSAWHNKYDRFEVRDIEYHHTINIHPSTIGDVIPPDFYNRIMKAARASQIGNKNAIQFFEILNRNFLHFEKDNYRHRVFDTVSTFPDSFEVIEVIPTMDYYKFSDDVPQILLPGSYRVRFRTTIDGKKIVNKCTVYIDIDKLKDIFRELISLTNSGTKNLKLE